MKTALSVLFALWLVFITVKLLFALLGFVQSWWNRKKGTNP